MGISGTIAISLAPRTTTYVLLGFRYTKPFSQCLKIALVSHVFSGVYISVKAHAG